MIRTYPNVILFAKFLSGANTGIGLETVKALYQSDQHYRILLGGRNLEKAQLACQNVTTEGTQNTVEPFLVDIESDESIEAALDQIAAKYGRVDCLINNAGLSHDISWKCNPTD